MKRTALILALLFGCTTLAAAAADSADQPSSMVCALGKVTICNVDGCRESSLDAVGAPGMVRLDLDTGDMFAVTASTVGRRSTFRTLERKEGRVALQGFENGRAFSATIDADGIASIATSTEGSVFVMFGRCVDLAIVTAGSDSEPPTGKR